MARTIHVLNKPRDQFICQPTSKLRFSKGARHDSADKKECKIKIRLTQEPAQEKVDVENCQSHSSPHAFIIPILILVFGADIRTAGTASVLISLPVTLTGVARHWLTGHYRSQSMLAYLVLPMCIGSLVGAVVGGYLAAWAPIDVLRVFLAAILAVSAIKL